MDSRPLTFILDVDACLLKQEGGPDEYVYKSPPTLLPGVLDFFRKAEAACCKLILLSGRKESTRAETEAQLKAAHLYWDTLVLGVGGGVRFLTNNVKVYGTKTAFALNLGHNAGMEGVYEMAVSMASGEQVD